MEILKTFGLFCLTALAEIVGCYLPYLWFKNGRSVWLLVPAAFSLAAFVWLLTLHPSAAGRVYAAYGGVYVGVAIPNAVSSETVWADTANRPHRICWFLLTRVSRQMDAIL